MGDILILQQIFYIGKIGQEGKYTGKIRQVAETYIKKIGQAGKEGKIREKAEIITPRFCNSFLFSGLTGLRFLQKRVRFPP